MKLKYYELYQNCKDAFFIRIEMVKYSKVHGIVATAKEFQTTPKTIRKWVKRYTEHGNKGLKDVSKRPKSSPNQMNKEWESILLKEVEKRREKNKRIIVSHIKRKLSIPYSLTTLLKVLRKNNLFKKTRKKHERKRDLREIKQQYRAFEKLQIDVKYLDDIPEFYLAYKQYDLPRFQITARCIKTGALFLSYMYHNNVVNSTLFLYMLQNHLEKHGFSPSMIRIQTDNGPEFVKPNSLNESLFTKTVTQIMKSKHYRIPPGAKTWQSDVESSHRLIEDEFYSDISVYSRDGFLRKSYDYQSYFNLIRCNKYKGGTPLYLLKKEFPQTSNKVLKFKPVILDKKRKILKTINKLIA